MCTLNRYIFRKLVFNFLFLFYLVAGVFWLNRAVLLFDVLNDGLSFAVYAKLALLVLPYTFYMTLPTAAYITCVYTTYRMIMDSELIILQSIGLSHFRIAVPYIYFGVLVVALMALLGNSILPWSSSKTAQAWQAINDKIDTDFIPTGQFVFLNSDFVLYAQNKSEFGELQNLFIGDTRAADLDIALTAQKGLPKRDTQGLHIVLLDGTLQSFDKNKNELSVLDFQELIYNIDTKSENNQTVNSNIYTWQTKDLLLNGFELVRAGVWADDAWKKEIANRIITPILMALQAVMGMAVLMMFPFLRSGAVYKIVVSVVVFLGMQVVLNFMNIVIGENPHFWPYYCVVTVVFAVCILLLLWLSEKTNMRYRTINIAGRV